MIPWAASEVLFETCRPAEEHGLRHASAKEGLEWEVIAQVIGLALERQERRRDRQRVLMPERLRK